MSASRSQISSTPPGGHRLAELASRLREQLNGLEGGQREQGRRGDQHPRSSPAGRMRRDGHRQHDRNGQRR